MSRGMGVLSVRVACIVLAGVLGACAEPPPPKAPPAPKSAPAPQASATPPGTLDRATLEIVLREGPPWLLERVPIEEVMESGKFAGWRVLELPPEWQGIELAPGDVVTTVNGMPLETQDQFWSAWTTLTVASEIKVAYLREGQPRELSIPVHGQPDPAITQEMARPAPAAGQRAVVQDPGPKRGRTIVIKSEEKPFTDTVVDYSVED